MIIVSLLFGFGHYYKGAAGVLDSTYSGFVLGAFFLLSGRDLWTPSWRMALPIALQCLRSLLVGQSRHRGNLDKGLINR